MKLIDKDVIATEIKSYISNYKEIAAKTDKNDSTWVDSVSMIEAKIDVLQLLLLFIDTLEVKEVDLETELNGWRHNYFHGRRDKEAGGEYLERDSQLSLAKHFFELGLQVTPNQDEWNKENIKPPFTITMDGNKYSNPMLCYDEFGNYCIAQYVKWHTGHYGWYDNEEEVSITHWKELKARKGEENI